MTMAMQMAAVLRQRGVDTIATHLAKTYGVKVIAVTPLDIGVHRIDLEGAPPWVARVFDQDRPLERTRSDATLLAHVAAAGLPAERPAMDEPISMLDGQAVLLTSFVPGNEPAKSDNVIRRLADLLGRLHALPVIPGIEPGGALHHLPRFEGAPGREIALAAALLDDIADRIPASGRQRFESLRQVVATADDCGDLPHALVHPDPVMKNVVSTPDRQLALVDWTGGGVGPRIVSLAPLLMHALRPTGWDGKTLEMLAKAYRAHVQLEDREIDRLGSALLIRHLWRAAWTYWTRTIKGNPPSGTEWWMPLPPRAYAALSRYFTSAD